MMLVNLNLEYKIKNFKTQKDINPNIEKLDIKLDQIEKSIFQHFMLKEIMNQTNHLKIV